jgi:hypothetical protein
MKHQCFALKAKNVLRELLGKDLANETMTYFFEECRVCTYLSKMWKLYNQDISSQRKTITTIVRFYKKWDTDYTIQILKSNGYNYLEKPIRIHVITKDISDNCDYNGLRTLECLEYTRETILDGLEDIFISYGMFEINIQKLSVNDCPIEEL